MSKMKELFIATSLALLLNSADKSLIAQTSELKLDTAKTDTIKTEQVGYEKYDFAKELLDLEKQSGFDIQFFHYSPLDSLVSKVGKDMRFGGVAEDSKKTQALNNLEKIARFIRGQNYIYTNDDYLLFHKALESKKLNSFHYLMFYLEIAAQKNLPIVPVKAGNHFFISWYLDKSNYFNWEVISGTEQENKSYKKSIKKTTKELREINKESFLAHAYKSIGIALNEKKQYQEAVNYFDKSMIANMTDPETHYNQGNSWFSVENYVKAIDDYDMAIHLDKNFIQAYKGRGDSWYKLGDLDKALKDYSTAIELNPDDPSLYQIRGEILVKRKKPEKAKKDYEKALELILKK